MRYDRLETGGGIPNFLQESGGKPKKGGIGIEMGGCHFFITL